MKRCYNYEILWVSIFALLLLCVAALQPYNTEGFSVKSKELNGEDLNNHSCPKLMNNSVYLKDHYKNFNRNARTIASFMEPGLSEEYMETDSQKHLKGMCIIPDDKISSYNLFVQEDPVNGWPSQICKATFTDNVTNEEKEVVMPYVSDVNSGCALVFSNYGNNPKQAEILLDNLSKLSSEYNEKIKAKNIQQKNIKQNEYNSFENVNRQINNSENTYNRTNERLSIKRDQKQRELDMATAIYNQRQSQNQQYKTKLTPTWY